MSVNLLNQENVHTDEEDFSRAKGTLICLHPSQSWVNWLLVKSRTTKLLNENLLNLSIRRGKLCQESHLKLGRSWFSLSEKSIREVMKGMLCRRSVAWEKKLSTLSKKTLFLLTWRNLNFGSAANPSRVKRYCDQPLNCKQRASSFAFL